MKKLPIGISTFEKIRTGDFYYLDKTGYVAELAEQAGYFFLARPRRFGKSLFLDTLKCAFEGKRELFRGLHLEQNWDWNTSWPVILISFGGARFTDIENLEANIDEILEWNGRRLGVDVHGRTVNGRFNNLLIAVSEKFQKRAVVLVDEYDKPILDNLENPQQAEALRDGLKNFYSVLKDGDRYLRFCFITGVSRFSRVSIFSDLNNLEDLSLEPEMGAICGYTEREIEEVFEEQLTGVDRPTLRTWYNGYNFLGPEKVFNPFDVLLFFKKKQYGNYWFESATPSFLVQLLRNNRIYLPHLEHLQIDQGLLSGFDLERIRPEAVLFQSGYLTIGSVQELAPGQRIFTLNYPNQEVRVGLTMHLLEYLTGNPSSTGSLRLDMARALRERDMPKVKSRFQALFHSIPNEWYTGNNMNNYEGYYASVVYAFVTSLGFVVRPEESSSHGRADLIIDTGNTVYVLEFKVVELVGDGKKGLTQIRERGYHQQYVQSGREVVLIGIDFSKKERNIVGFETETAKLF